ncbi:MAG TPA: hypothetical protein VED17_09470, partial [Nitrososphaerales archaeon]|nr:hypothetical protein [Nitrososphaerales archaeon]
MSQPKDQKFFWQKNFPDVSSSLSREELAQAANLENVDRQTLSTVVRRPSARANSRMFQETKLIIGIPVH